MQLFFIFALFVAVVWNFGDSTMNSVFAKINNFPKVSEIFGNVYSGFATSKKGREKMKLYDTKQLKKDFPKGYAYLKKCESVLREREKGRFDIEKWFQFGRAQGLKGQYITKLLCPDICNTTQFTLDDSGKFYFTATIYGYILSEKFADLDYKYLLAVLNS